MSETNMTSTKRARSLCETVHDVFQLTMQSQTRQLARASKEIATKESVRDQMRKDCERLGIQNIDKDLPPVVHIAGTKGKGSTCALLESVLRAGDFRTGLFTSPHLVDVRERIRINGSVLPKATFEDHVMKTYNLLGHDRMETIGFFQFMTLLMFRIFAKTTPGCQNADVLVLETGIGGRLDFTNALDNPLCCGITRLDYDHTEILGNTLTKIAGEKAGIIKHNVKVFTPANQADEGLKVIIEASRKLDAPLEIVPPLEHDSLRIGIEGGAHQLENAGLAWAMADHVFKMLRPGNPPSEQVYRDGLAFCRFPGRAQREQGSNGLHFYLDGAHTPLSVEYASKWFSTVVPTSEQKVLIFHCSPDRDGKGMLSIIHKTIPDVKQAYMLAPSSGLNAGGPSHHEYLALAWNALSQDNTAIAYREGPEQFRKEILEMFPSKGIKHVFIVGSFYLVGDALKYWIDDWSVENAFKGSNDEHKSPASDKKIA